eukprot:TRINITY_DN10144_c0_g1_i1.p1 TRINITY_DN10144_c0_g1~~TRINITY_DN10144_c0_g1_i1.p1  ORF type:complete len:977 (+),score=230.33 TRINITY_DN10144_c0_g1_i1:112-3042(+)
MTVADVSWRAAPLLPQRPGTGGPTRRGDREKEKGGARPKRPMSAGAAPKAQRPLAAPPAWACPMTNRKQAREGPRVWSHPKDVAAAETALRQQIAARQRMDWEVLLRRLRGCAAELQALSHRQYGTPASSASAWWAAESAAPSPLQIAASASPPRAWRPASAGATRLPTTRPVPPTHPRPHSAGVSRGTATAAAAAVDSAIRSPGGALAAVAAAAPLPLIGRGGSAPLKAQGACPSVPHCPSASATPSAEALPKYPTQRPCSGRVRGTGGGAAATTPMRPQSAAVAVRPRADTAGDPVAGELTRQQWGRAVRMLVRESRAVRSMVEVEWEAAMKLVASNIHYGRLDIESAAKARQQAALNKLLRDPRSAAAAGTIAEWYVQCKQGAFGRRALHRALKTAWKAEAEGCVSRAQDELTKQYDYLQEAVREHFEHGWYIEQLAVRDAETGARESLVGGEEMARAHIVALLHMNDDDIVLTAKANRIADAECEAREHVLVDEGHDRLVLTSARDGELLLVAPGHREAALRIEAFFLAAKQGDVGWDARRRRLQYEIRCLRERRGLSNMNALASYVKTSQNELASAINELERFKDRHGSRQGSSRRPSVFEHEAARARASAHYGADVTDTMISPRRHGSRSGSPQHSNSDSGRGAKLVEGEAPGLGEDSTRNLSLLQHIITSKRARESKQVEWEETTHSRIAVLEVAFEASRQLRVNQMEADRSKMHHGRFKDRRDAVINGAQAAHDATAAEEAAAFDHLLDMFQRYHSVIVTALAVKSPLMGAADSTSFDDGGTASASTTPPGPDEEPLLLWPGAAGISPAKAAALARLERKEAGARGLIHQACLDMLQECSYAHEEAVFTIIWRGTRRVERAEGEARVPIEGEEACEREAVTADALRAIDALARRERFRRAAHLQGKIAAMMSPGSRALTPKPAVQPEPAQRTPPSSASTPAAAATPPSPASIPVLKDEAERAPEETGT